MDATTASCRGLRFPPEIISHAVWLYDRFCLSFRDVEDLLAQRGIAVSCESIHHWCRKLGAGCARRLKRREGRLGDSGTWTDSSAPSKASGSTSGGGVAAFVDRDGASHSRRRATAEHEAAKQRPPLSSPGRIY